MVHLCAGQAQRAGLIHDQQIAGAAAGAARPVVEGRDHDEIGRLALALVQPLALTLSQLGRDPMRAVRALDVGLAALAEAQRRTSRGAPHIGGLAGLQAAPLRPAAEVPHRLRDLAEVGVDRRLQVRDPAPAPRLLAGGGKPAQADEDIDGGDEPARGERRLGRGDHALLESLVVVGGHSPAAPCTLPMMRPIDPQG